MLKKLSKKQKLIIPIAIFSVIVIITILIGANIIRTNMSNEKYSSSNSDSNNGNLLPEYIKAGITLGGVTGTLESLDTSDATATAEDILWGKTAYVKGKKVIGTYKNNYIPIQEIIVKDASVSQNDKQVQMSVTIIPENATNKKLIWTSSNPDIVSIDENGLVTILKGIVGKYTITATSANDESVNSQGILTITASTISPE